MILERHKTTSFHWLLHTRFYGLVRWTVIIGAMLKTGFGKTKVHIRGFVNEQTICGIVILIVAENMCCDC